jgi:protein involved in polysaccharide export with SLBB domain
LGQDRARRAANRKIPDRRTDLLDGWRTTTMGIPTRAGSVKRSYLVLLLGGILASAVATGGCGGPYYVEGQDELGDLPDSLRIVIEQQEQKSRARTEGVRTDKGVVVRELGDTDDRPLALEYSPEGPYLLRRGDRVTVEVLFYPELETSTVVRPDGKITASGIGDVPALGRRPEEVAADIEAYYSRILRDPTTTVNVVDFGERRAYVFGMVNRPGALDLEQRMTLTQALASSGSVNEDAKLATVVLLRRKSENSAQAYRLDLRGVLEGKSLAADIVLQPDDVIYVPRTFVADMEQFVSQVFRGLLPIPELFLKTYDSIHVSQRAAIRVDN